MTNIFHVIIQIITLIVIGWIVRHLWQTSSRYGAMIQKAYKAVGWGVIFLAFNTFEEVVEHLTGFGTQTFFSQDAHDIFHAIVVLTGFSLFAWGLFKIVGTHRAEE